MIVARSMAIKSVQMPIRSMSASVKNGGQDQRELLSPFALYCPVNVVSLQIVAEARERGSKRLADEARARGRMALRGTKNEK